MSASLGDYFPQKTREDFIDRQMKIGSVFRIYTEDTIPPKIKRFVIIGINEGIGSVAILYINTDPSTNTYLQQYQLYLEKNEFREFLDHHSYLDCAKLYEKDIISISKRFTADISSYIGCMSEDDIKQASSLVKNAKTVSVKIKKKYAFI